MGEETDFPAGPAAVRTAPAVGGPLPLSWPGRQLPKRLGTLSGGQTLSGPSVGAWSLDSSHLGCQRLPCAFLSLASLASEG